MRNAHCKTRNMVRNTEKRGKEDTNTVSLEYGEKT
jgi:hypothetical protein